MENKAYTLLTGATGGLGQAFLRECLKNGYNNLIITGTKQTRLDALKEQIQNEFTSANLIAFKCDFLEPNDIDKLISFLDSKNITIDCLINNAGYITEGSVKHCSIETLHKCIMVNNDATVKLTKLILDRKSSDLRIITVGSMAGNYPMPYMAIYSATKSFLKQFMLSVREEYKKDGVKVLLVEPGAIATSEAMKEAIKAQGFKGKLSAVSPDKIAKNSIKKSLKNKSTYIPGFFNKLTNFVSNITPIGIQIRVIGKMWKKSQEKRNIK